MRRVLGSLMIAGLLFAGAACGSSSPSKPASTTGGGSTGTTAAAGGSGGGTTSSNAAVQAYCKSVDDYVAKVKAALGDTSKMAALSAQATDLSTKATALATSGLSAADGQAVAACTTKSTNALKGG